MIKLFFVFAFISATLSNVNDKPAYILYDSEGIQTSYTAMLDTLKNADIILIGEFHDNPISHWMEYEITKDLFYYKKFNMVLGAEMFEADNQEGLDKYLKGEIDDKKLAEEVRLWPNFKTDYKPLLDFAKKMGLKFIATNIPRTYANMVFKGGFEALDELNKKEKAWIAPLPILYEPNLKCYQKMLSMNNHAMTANENLPKAQAIKDATMAYFILENWQEGKTFIHYNGAYHSDGREGIYWYLKMKNKNLKIVTISTVTQQDINKLEDENRYLADFIICVPETMTRTY
ncbi:MAG: ChaN family lipoprotein [Marinilabiliales bacterium]